jgi:hypothetical protein
MQNHVRTARENRIGNPDYLSAQIDIFEKILKNADCSEIYYHWLYCGFGWMYGGATYGLFRNG